MVAVVIGSCTRSVIVGEADKVALRLPREDYRARLVCSEQDRTGQGGLAPPHRTKAD